MTDLATEYRIALQAVAEHVLGKDPNGTVMSYDDVRWSDLLALLAQVARLEEENAGLRADAVFLAREAGNDLPIPELLVRLRETREESEEA